MLYLIGLGLVENDITLKGIESMKKCDSVFCELYTNRWMGDLKNLEKNIGKKIKILSRSEVESDFLEEEARNKDVALLISGDPMSATTHFEMIFQAKSKGIKYEIIHAPSIYTSVADTGLSLYKFGRATTLVYPEKNYSPSSPYEVIEKNKKIGLHTLVLLDIKEERMMTPKDAIEILLELEKEKGGNIISRESKILVCCKMGSPDVIIKYDKIENLAADRQLQQTPAVLIIPGELNFKEEEALTLWR